ncbi:helix-turn-helix domain-containing protein [Treponema sp. Marseille-Q4130]|uniref:helix-turn-helix domain-containing protein n=1 Tax=Treponema sp. Marseille-Q4130 TaxID=2766702 RepID=UPI00165238BB|nr:helix-turn-helix transcriptional regulator [Treponema sp. Marseille-Q4130]MBC6720348.1 helix-turn-helix transcriptional regulator [Treponema sp. Marseille-Q4130]
MDAVSFWNRVKQLIKSNNTTQRGLSETIGLSARTLEIKIGRKSAPDVFEAYKIAQALGVSVEYLVTGSDTNPAERELKELKERLKNLVE